MQMNEIKFEHWSTSRLLPYARNPRKNDHVVDQMAAAIIKRWQDFTGKQAVHEETKKTFEELANAR